MAIYTLQLPNTEEKRTLEITIGDNDPEIEFGIASPIRDNWIGVNLNIPQILRLMAFLQEHLDKAPNCSIINPSKRYI